MIMLMIKNDLMIEYFQLTHSCQVYWISPVPGLQISQETTWKSVISTISHNLPFFDWNLMDLSIFKESSEVFSVKIYALWSLRLFAFKLAGQRNYLHQAGSLNHAELSITPLIKDVIRLLSNGTVAMSLWLRLRYLEIP